MSKTTKKQAFTLVELIVTIVILAILWTIAFISFGWYSRNSRDSVRIADLNSVRKSLEIFITKTWFYPTPDNETPITYSWATVWIEWTIWDNVIKNIQSVSEKPIDPLTQNEYTYSVTPSKTEYQIWSISEAWWLTYTFPLNKSFAADLSKTSAVAYIVWNYNEKFIKVQTWTTSWILADPSIIATDISNPDLWNIIASKKLSYDSYSNFPHSYNQTLSWWFNFSPWWSMLVYTSNSWSSFESDNDKLVFLSNLKTFYSWTILGVQPSYIEITNSDPVNDEIWSISLVDSFIKNKVWWIDWELSDINSIQISRKIPFTSSSNFILQNAWWTKFLSWEVSLVTPFSGSVIDTWDINTWAGYSIYNSSEIAITFFNYNIVEMTFKKALNITTIIQTYYWMSWWGSYPMSGANAFYYWDGSSRINPVYNTTTQYGYWVLDGRLNTNVTTTKIKVQSMTFQNWVWQMRFSLYWNNGVSYYVTTNDSSQIDTTNMWLIKWVTLTTDEPTNTAIKYLVSFDWRTTWKYWNWSSWATTTLANIKTTWMTKNTLESLNSTNWSSSWWYQQWITTNLNFAFDLESAWTLSPKLSEINVKFNNE